MISQRAGYSFILCIYYEPLIVLQLSGATSVANIALL